MRKFDAEIKAYKDGKTIWIYHNQYLPFTYNSKRCRYVCNCYYYDRAVHILVAVDMRTLLDWADVILALTPLADQCFHLANGSQTKCNDAKVYLWADTEDIDFQVGRGQPHELVFF